MTSANLLHCQIDIYEILSTFPHCKNPKWYCVIYDTYTLTLWLPSCSVMELTLSGVKCDFLLT